MTPSDTSTSGSRRVRVPDGRITLFGHEPTTGELDLLRRTRRWRLRRSAVPAAATAVVAPLVTLLPPHAPWAVGALAGGFILTRRRWKEEFTVEAFRGRCPRCGAELELPAGSRLRFPHPLHCDECRHEPVLELEPERLRAMEPRPPDA